MRSSLDRPDPTVALLADTFTSQRPMYAARLALRTRSSAVREAMARSLPGGDLTEAELVRLAVDERLPGELLRGRPGRVVAALALTWAGLGRGGPGLEASALTYRALWADGARDDLPPPHHHLAAQAMLLTGRADELRELLPRLTRIPSGVRPFLETDLANPYPRAGDDPAQTGPAGMPGAPQHDRHRAWEELLSGPFTDRGLAPLRVAPPADGSAHLFDRLSAPGVAPGSVDGPPVTVVVPCFRPDEGLLTSVASLVAQSYGPLQVLLVDDASGPGHQHWFERAVALDEDRVRVLRRDTNGGAYLARNDALAAATGQLVTFQDADDWAHPERVAAQVAWLEEHPAAPACRTLAVRVHDDLTHQWIGYPPVRAHASSLMVRSSVVERVGGFLPVRKGADSEYTERLVAEAGPVGLTRAPLAAYRLRHGSLSRGDFSYQWAAPERLSFKGTYRAWQRAGRPPGFPAPVPFVRGLHQHRSSESLDTAYLGDFSADPRADAGRASEVWTLPADSAGQIGLWHLERPWDLAAERSEMHDRWFDRIVAEPAWQALTRTEPVEVARLVVLDPAVLLLAGDQDCAVTARSVVVRLHPQEEPAPDRDAVAHVVRRWFGLEPEWVDSSGQTWTGG